MQPESLPLVELREFPSEMGAAYGRSVGELVGYYNVRIGDPKELPATTPSYSTAE
jgi:hypothetical protein